MHLSDVGMYTIGILANGGMYVSEQIGKTSNRASSTSLDLVVELG